MKTENYSSAFKQEWNSLCSKKHKPQAICITPETTSTEACNERNA
jgi:hypothetical protein